MVPDDSDEDRRDGGGTESETALVYPLVGDRGNRRVLNEWLGGHERYELVAPPRPDLQAEFDCLLVDRHSLVEWQAAICERMARDRLLPIVLLVDESEEERIRTELRERRGLWAQIDAVVPMPIRESRFEDQLALLLKLRSQSREIDTQRAEVEILNRVLRHDIRNDLNVMLGWAEILEAHVDASGIEYLDRITHSGRHIVELTEVAHDIAEQIASGGEPDLVPVDLNEVLTEEVYTRQELFDAATIERLDAPETDTAVWANEMLSSVFRNLINNAVQHNDSDAPTVEITVDRRADSVVVSIADDGPGLPTDLRERIFDEGFKGLDSTGTGLGLYLVHSLVDAYGGAVWIEDNEPRGSIFAVELRIAEAPTPPRDIP